MRQHIKHNLLNLSARLVTSLLCINTICLCHFYIRYGWMQEPKSSSPMPSAWAVSLLWEVTMPTTITATGKDVDTSR